MPYWLDIPYAPRPKLAENIETEVVVVGGGITGVSAAYHSTRNGLKTVLIEKNIVASGSAGKNAGMLIEGAALDFVDLRNRFGIEEATERWRETVQSREYVFSLIRELAIDCDIQRPGSLYIIPREADDAWLRKESEARNRAGLSGRVIEPNAQFPKSSLGTAIYTSDDCLLHPVKFVRGLASAAETVGATIYEGTEVLSIDSTSVVTAQGTVKAETVIVATESDSASLSPDKYLFEWEQALVTEPLSDESISNLNWTYGGMFWMAGPEHPAVRRIGNRLLICQAVASHEEENREKNRADMTALLQSYFPNLNAKEIVISHEWVGPLLHSEKKFTRINIHRGFYEILGQGGNGLTYGMMSGKMVADALVGKPLKEFYLE